MQVLVDTNVLLRSAKTDDEHHAVAADALRQLRISGEQLFVSAQLIYEYLSVATRSTQENGLGLTVSRSLRDTDDIQGLFTLVLDTPDTLSNLRSLVDRYQVVGKRIHDAHLVATMLSHGISHILTFNHRDFVGFEQVTILEPHEIAMSLTAGV